MVQKCPSRWQWLNSQSTFLSGHQWPDLQWIKNVLYVLKNFMTNICCIRTLLALLCTLSTFWNLLPNFDPVSVYAWPFQDDVSKFENKGQHQILYLKQLPVCLSIFLCSHEIKVQVWYQLTAVSATSQPQNTSLYFLVSTSSEQPRSNKNAFYLMVFAMYAWSLSCNRLIIIHWFKTNHSPPHTHMTRRNMFSCFLLFQFQHLKVDSV